jgi:CRISPR/Cas system-associated exonuclease Cas4 (RecB family)
VPKPPVRVAVAETGASLPGHVSASQLDSYSSCGLRYYFDTVLGFRQPETVWTTLGTLLHDTLERLYRLEPGERSATTAVQLMVEVARGMFATPAYRQHADNREIRTRAEAALRNLFALETPSRLEVAPADLESAVTVELNGVAFTGRLDRRTRAPLRRICDYKSGRRPPAYRLPDKLTQVYLYAAAARAEGDPVDEVELFYLGGDGGLVRRPVYPAALDAAVDRLTLMRRDTERDLAEGQFTATPTALCGFCPFKPACPAYNAGAAPPGSAESDARLATLGLRRRGHRPEAVELAEREREAEDLSEAVW